MPQYIHSKHTIANGSLPGRMLYASSSMGFRGTNMYIGSMNNRDSIKAGTSIFRSYYSSHSSEHISFVDDFEYRKARHLPITNLIEERSKDTALFSDAAHTPIVQDDGKDFEALASPLNLHGVVEMGTPKDDSSGWSENGNSDRRFSVLAPEAHFPRYANFRESYLKYQGWPTGVTPTEMEIIPNAEDTPGDTNYLLFSTVKSTLSDIASEKDLPGYVYVGEDIDAVPDYGSYATRTNGYIMPAINATTLVLLIIKECSLKINLYLIKMA